MNKLVISSFCVLLLLQVAFAYNLYPNGYPLIRPASYPFQLNSRLAAVPVVNQMNASPNVKAAGAQISRGSEMFSFEMFHVSLIFDRPQSNFC